MNETAKLLSSPEIAPYGKFTDKRSLSLFRTTFVACLISHFLFYSNMIKNADCWQISNIYQAGAWEVSIGRWLLPYLDRLRGSLNLPYVTALLSFLYLSMAVAVIARVLRLDKVQSLLLSFSLVLAPFLFITLTYTYCSDSYILAFLLSVLSVYILECCPARKWYHILLSALLLTATMAIYQVYLSTALVLFLFVIIKSPAPSFREFFRREWHFPAACALSVVLYLLGFKISQQIYGVSTNLAYGVYSQPLAERLAAVPGRIAYIYQSFFRYFFTGEFCNNCYKRPLLIACFFLLIFLLWLFFSAKKRSFLLQLLALALLPLAAGLTLVISPNMPLSMRLSAPILLCCPCLLVLLPQKEVSGKPARAGRAGVYLLYCVYLWTCFLSLNATYEIYREFYNQERTYASEIVGALEYCEDYERGMPICIIGTINAEDHGLPSDIYKKAYTWDISMYKGEYEATAKDWETFLSHELGVRTVTVDRDKFAEIYASKAFREMAIFPREGSLQLIDGIMVVKLSDTQ